MELGRLGPTGPPGGKHPAVRRGSLVFELGAERSAARECDIPDDSEDEEGRAAGGPGSEPSIRRERGAFTD